LTCWREVVAALSMKEAVGAAKSDNIEPKLMSTGLEMKSAMLAWKTTQCDEAIELREELWIYPYLARQLSDV
jgi:hypothetical protein